MKEIIIPGKPVALKRHRTGNNTFYDPQRLLKRDLLMSVSEVLGEIELTDAPLVVVMEFTYAYPRSISKKKLREMRDMGKVPRTARPDCDNLLKMYLDLFNGKIWRDDSQIFALSGAKYYGEANCTTIQWEEY